MDFNIEQILSNAEPVLAVRQVTTVDTTALVTILRQLGQKIEDQDAMIAALRDEVIALKREAVVFRANAEEYSRLKGDVAGLIEDVEAVTMYAKLPKVPNRARDGTLRSFLGDAHTNRSTSEPAPVNPDDRSAAGLYAHPQQQQRSIVVATQMTPSSAGISRTASRPHPSPIQQPQQAPQPVAQQQQGGRPRTGLTMEADPEANGLRVTDVKANSAAAEAGVRPGDIIIASEGQPTATSADFVGSLDGKRVGDGLRIQYVREGSVKEVIIRLKGKQSAYSEDH